MSLSQQEKDLLKSLARQTIEGVLFGKKRDDFEPTDALKELSGAFVTIKERENLRGCIGYIRGVLPLYKTIEEMSIQAAFHDPRFAPLDKEEWKDIDIEISVLTPLEKVDDVEKIEVGVHGLYLENGRYAGLLLPQVATEYNWDRITFLEHTCYKAGLPKDAWKSADTDVYIFSAEVF